MAAFKFLQHYAAVHKRNKLTSGWEQKLAMVQKAGEQLLKQERRAAANPNPSPNPNPDPDPNPDPTPDPNPSPSPSPSPHANQERRSAAEKRLELQGVIRDLELALGECTPSLGVVARRGQLGARGDPPGVRAPGVGAACTRVAFPAGAAAAAAAAAARESGQATTTSLP